MAAPTMMAAAPSQPSAQLTLRLSETARAMNAPTQRKAPTMKPRCTVGQYQRGRTAIVRSTCSVPYSFVRFPKPIPAATETTAPNTAHTAPIRRIVRSRSSRHSSPTGAISFRSGRRVATVILHSGDDPGDDRGDHRQKLDPSADEHAQPIRREQGAHRAAREEPEKQEQPHDRTDERDPLPRYSGHQGGRRQKDHESRRDRRDLEPGNYLDHKPKSRDKERGHRRFASRGRQTALVHRPPKGAGRRPRPGPHRELRVIGFRSWFRIVI